jgi:hypothetical protein
MNENEGTTESLTPKRLEANRRNARKSTGPRTTEGKAIVSMNAIKHGMLSRQVVVRGMQVHERPKEFQELRQRLWDELMPVGAVEEMLVDRIVTAHWRMRRAVRAECGEIALSVDGGHWERLNKDPIDKALFAMFSDPMTELGKSARGLSYLMHILEELRETVTREGGLTDAALGQLRRRFGERESSFGRELVKLREELSVNPGGLSPEALQAEQRERVLGRIEGRMNLYRMLQEKCEEREEKEESARQAAQLLPESAILDKILRYEGKLERQLYRAMNQLERLQRRRNGEVVPPPITMDVS